MEACGQAAPLISSEQTPASHLYRQAWGSLAGQDVYGEGKCVTILYLCGERGCFGKGWKGCFG